MAKPKLRFPEFMDEWERKVITEIADTYIGLVTTMTAHYVDNGTPLIRNSDIKENKFVFKEPIYLDKEFADINSSRKHKLNDIITVHTGDIGTSALITEELVGSIGFATIVTRITETNIFPQYICWYYNTDIYKNYARNICTGDGRNNLNMRDFNVAKLSIPCLKEQQKIADFLSKMDEKISNQEAVVSDYEELKKGLMQKIFSQEIRFKADDGSEYPEWEEKTFGDVFEILEYGMNTAATDYDGFNKYIRITDIDDTSHKYLTTDIVSPSGVLSDKYLVQENDILFARTGASTGKSYLYRQEDGKLYFAGFLIRGHVKESYNSFFIFSQTLTEQYHRWVKIMSIRSGQPGINATEYAQFKFLCPCLEEQQKIANCLSAMDKKIEAEKKILEDWKELKKALLQQMFV